MSSEPIPVCVNEIRAVQNDFDTYDIDPVPVGSGGWGTIYRGVRKSDGKVFSLKFFGYTNRAPSQSDINDEIVQMFTMAGVEGVIQIESIFYDTPGGMLPNKERALQHSYPVIVMENLSGGDLLHRIDARARSGHPVSERYLAATFRSAMIALQGIHKRFFIHRDIKVANLLLQSDAEDSPVKIIDFGSLIQLDHASKCVVTEEAHGTPMSMAPESLPCYSRVYSTATDVWQAGCVLFHMLCADNPFHSQKDIKAGVYNTESPLHPRLSAEARDLLAGMLRVEPRERFTLEAVLAHPWLSHHDTPNTGTVVSDDHLGDEYTLRVKALAIRRKLKSMFVPLLPSPPPPGQCDDGSVESIDEAEARHYFDVILKAAGKREDGLPVVSRAGLRAGMAQLLSDSSHTHPRWHAGHSRGHSFTLDDNHDDRAHGSGSELRLTPGVGVNVDEMFDVMLVDGKNVIGFEEFRKFYVIATRGHT